MVLSVGTDAGRLIAEIRNAAWLVRYYTRNRVRRAQAITKLGIAVRHALESSSDYESILAAVLDGLRPKDEERPF